MEMNDMQAQIAARAWAMTHREPSIRVPRSTIFRLCRERDAAKLRADIAEAKLERILDACLSNEQDGYTFSALVVTALIQDIRRIVNSRVD